MTFYQELQLDQIGSKRYLKNLTAPKESIPRFICLRFY